MEAGGERSLRRRCVKVVWGHDRDKVDAILASAFRSKHCVEGRIGAFPVYAIASSGLRRAFRIAAESTGGELDFAVEFGRHSVYGSDERSRAAADHSHPELHGVSRAVRAAGTPSSS